MRSVKLVIIVFIKELAGIFIAVILVSDVIRICLPFSPEQFFGLIHPFGLLSGPERPYISKEFS